MRILKYVIKAQQTMTIAHEIEMQVDAIFLKAENQNGMISMWFEVDENKTIEKVFFMVLHTGNYKPDNPSIYLDTILFDEGSYVLHLYKLIK